MPPSYSTGHYIPVQNTQWQQWYMTTTSTTITGSYSSQWVDNTWNSWWNSTTSTYAPTPAPRPTEEELEARRQEYRRLDEEHRQRIRERAAREEEAHARSLELLKLVLTAEEYAEYSEGDGFIRITGSAGGRYEIRQRGYEGNVSQLDEMNEEVMRLCAHPRQNYGQELPHGDMWVGQILAIKTDEEHFLATANVHWRRPAPRNRSNFPVAA